MFSAYPWERNPRNDSLPMSPDYHDQNHQHFSSRLPKKLVKLFDRTDSPSPNYIQCTRNPVSLNDLKCEPSMSFDFGQKASGPSHPSSSSKDPRHENPMVLTITIPEGRMPATTSKEGQPSSLNCFASLSMASPILENSELELNPPESMEEGIGNLDRQPRNTGKSCSACPFHKPRSSSLKIASRLPSKEQSSRLLSEATSGFRILGRGGSGSRLRQLQASSSNPKVPSLRQPLQSSFHRPTGRGGAGSSTRPLTSLKSPTAILRLLCRCKRNKQSESPEVPPPVRAQSSALNLNLHYQSPNDSLTLSNYSRDNLGSILFSPPSTASSTLGGLGLSISRNSDPDDNDDGNSYIEEAKFPTPNERRQRSLNKLSRIIGVLPVPISRSSVAFNNSLQKDSRTLFIGPTSSNISLANSTLSDYLHQFDLADDLPLDSRSYVEDDTPPSPITFSPPSPDKITPSPLPV